MDIIFSKEHEQLHLSISLVTMKDPSFEVIKNL